jgi:AcrR family transcriptional regulator
MRRVGRGQATRDTILEHAINLARRVGLEGLTIGRLATDLDLSKSGLFAHFRSKDALQVQVLDAAAERFIAAVIQPALQTPSGEPRLRELFQRWLDWEGGQEKPGGCIFVQAAAELDDREGPARDRLVELQKRWLDAIATIVRGAIREGHFKATLDADQFAHDLHGIMLGYHHAARLLRDRAGDARTRTAFENLISAARKSPARRK